jgi:hypothetical protein
MKIFGKCMYACNSKYLEIIGKSGQRKGTKDVDAPPPKKNARSSEKC